MMWFWNINAPDTGQFQNGQDHKDTYFDTSRKILSQDMNNVNFYYQLVKCHGHNVKYQQKNLITMYIHVKY